jgi:outer membrane protein OmpA-like peptidoglycan-associated protein
VRLGRRGASALVAVALVLGLAACAPAEATPGPAATAFVIGGRSNMPAPVPDGKAHEALDDAVDREAEVSIIVPDGEPDVVDSARLLITGANPVARDKSRQENREMLANAILAARADDEEADLLTALDLARREVGSVDGTLEIVVIDSGLSTVAPLDFTQAGMLDADPADVVAMLRPTELLPDLRGVLVTWQGLGDTFDPQQRLNPAQRKNLIAIWLAVLEAAGAEPVVIDEKPLTDGPEEDFPEVTPVPLPEPLVCETNVVVLQGGDVAFEPDSSKFRDEAAVQAVLEPIARQIVAGGFTATVTGTTANVGPMEGRIELSLRRAQAVVDVLVGLGVPRGALTAEGLGSDFPGYAQDHGPEGELLPGPAAENRKVIITLTKGELVCV